MSVKSANRPAAAPKFVEGGGTFNKSARFNYGSNHHLEATMNGLIYLIGLVVVIMFILSFLGLR
jgi:hypothetical protein